MGKSLTQTPRGTYRDLAQFGAPGAFPEDGDTPQKLLKGDGTESPISFTETKAFVDGEEVATMEGVAGQIDADLAAITPASIGAETPEGVAEQIAEKAVSSEIQFLEQFNRLPSAAILTSSVANPTVITTATNHGFTTGDIVGIDRHANSTPSLIDQHTVTVLSPTSFSVPVNVTTGGYGGTVGKVVKSTESPLIGTPWRQSISPSEKFPYVVPTHGLRAGDATLLYMGTEHTEPITSMSFLLAFRPSLAINPVLPGGITIALSADPVLNSTGTTGIYLPGRMLHMEVYSGGNLTVGLGTGEGGVNWSPPTSSKVVYSTPDATNPVAAARVGWLTNMLGMLKIDFSPGKMIVQVPGAEYEFLDERFNDDLIGRHWFMEVGGDTIGETPYLSVPHIQKVLLNSKVLDFSPGMGSQPYSGTLSRLSGRGPVDLPQKIRVLGEKDQFNNPGIIPPTAAIAAAGDTYTEGRYVGLGYSGEFVTPPQISMPMDNPFLSSASANDEVAYAVGDGILVSNGESKVIRVFGRFADNSNSKRVRIFSGVTGVVFDSGSVTTANDEWEIEIFIWKNSAFARNFRIKFISAGGTNISYASGSWGGYTDLRVEVSGVAAGDVIVRHAYIVINTRPPE